MLVTPFLQAFFGCFWRRSLEIALFMSVSIDVESMTSIIRWGIMSAVGTFNGNARNAGNRTVNVGTTRIIFKLLGLNSNCKSLVFNITDSIAMKVIHSIAMFTGLLISIPIP